MTRLGMAFAVAVAAAAGPACEPTDCALIACAGGFRLDLRVDATTSDPIRVAIDAEDGTSMWSCNPATSRCARESSTVGTRDFDFVLTMATATAPFAGVPCDATACIRIEVRGDSDDAEEPGTYGPENVVVTIVDDGVDAYSREFAPEYSRTENYGGESCGYCDSLASFEERATVN